MKTCQLLFVLGTTTLFSACAGNLQFHKPGLDVITMCTATANRYAYARDRLLYQEYGDLFTEDATFQLGPTQARGREAIVNALRERGPGAQTRHFSTVVSMHATDDTHARGVSYLLLYRKTSNAIKNGDNSVTEAWIIGEYHDNFEIHNGQCRISRRDVKIIFQGSELAASG